MRMRARIAAAALALCLAAAFLPAASLKPERGIQEFDSSARLDAWDFAPELDDPARWEPCEIWLLTATKGDEVFTWFGHSSLAVVLPDGDAFCFDYGLFSFGEGFYANFALGRLWYSAGCCRLEDELARYDAEGRSVRALRLRLRPKEKAAVAGFLFDNVRPEKSGYLYHYYKDNCATRIRDIIDRATGGALRAWAGEREGESFRRAASRSLSAGVFWDWLLNFLQSGRIDHKATLWDEMFLPSVLERALEESGLAEERRTLLDNSATDRRPQDLPRYSLARELPLVWLTAALCLALAVCAARGWRRAYGALGALAYLVLGLLGALLAFLCLFTDHDVSWFNENLIFVNPLLLWAAVSNLRFALGRTPLSRLKAQDRLFLGLSGLLVVLKLLFPSVLLQQNLQQLLTVVPLYLVRVLVPFKEAPKEPRAEAPKEPEGGRRRRRA